MEALTRMWPFGDHPQIVFYRLAGLSMILIGVLVAVVVFVF